MTDDERDVLTRLDQKMDDTRGDILEVKRTVERIDREGTRACT